MWILSSHVPTACASQGSFSDLASRAITRLCNKSCLVAVWSHSIRAAVSSIVLTAPCVPDDRHPENLSDSRLSRQDTRDGMGRPIIQISLKDFETRKNEIAAELWRAATEIGFFYLKDHGLTQAEMQQMLSLSEQFFKLPAEQKANFKFDLKKNIGWESGQQKRASAKVPELKESLQLKWHDMEGRWPTNEDVPDFESYSKNFMQKCQNISFQVLSCFAIGLGFEEDFFTRNHDVTKPDAQQTFRLMHYFSVEGKEFPEDFPRAGAHCDFETITLLFAKGAGLEVCPGREAVSEHAIRPNEWTPCPAIPGAITVNIGDALMRWSDDRLKSNYHRVRMPRPGEYQGSRYSIAYFNQANKSAVIQGPGKHYPPVTAQEFVKESLAAIYLSQEGQQGDNAAIIKAAKHPENAVLNAVD